MATRETATGVIGPTVEDQQINKQSSGKSWRRRLVEGLIKSPFGGVLAGIGGVAGAQVIDHESLPRTAGIIQQAKPTAEVWLAQKGILKNPNIFDNKGDYGKVSPKNSVSAPLDVIIEHTKIEKGKSLQVGWFLETPSPANITYVKGLPFSYTSEAYTNESVKEMYRKHERAGVKNTIAFTDIPLGTKVRSPFKGFISMADTGNSSGFLNLNLIFTDDEGRWYNFLFTGAKDVGMIAQPPKLDPKTRFSNLTGWQEVDIGDDLFTVQSQELVGGVRGFSYPSQLRVEATHGPNGFGKDPWIPTDIFFMTQDNKLLIPSN